MSYTTSFGAALKETREKSNMSRKAVANAIPISSDMLKLYETNKHTPDPKLSVDMAKLYCDPSLVFKRCVRACPIGQKFRYRVLNGVNESLAARLMKYRSELLEVLDMIDSAIDMTLNKTLGEDYSEREREALSELTLEICDISHNSDEIKLELMRLFGIETVEESIREHHSKCYRQGYLRDKEKAPLARAL